MHIADWLLFFASIFILVYFGAKMFYFKSLTEQEKRKKDYMKSNLKEAEIIIRKYQVQLHRTLGNMDALIEEMSKLRQEIKAVKKTNTNFRHENVKLKSKIKNMETRIEALH